jgi:hypothetical protein
MEFEENNKKLEAKKHGELFTRVYSIDRLNI